MHIHTHAYIYIYETSEGRGGRIRILRPASAIKESEVQDPVSMSSKNVNSDLYQLSSFLNKLGQISY